MKTGNITSSSLLGYVLAGLLTLPMLTACSNGSDNAEALSHLQRAETYAEQGQYRPAVIELKSAIQASPQNPDYVVALAELLLTVGANEEASNLLSSWLPEHPQKVTLPLARAYVGQGKHLSATETLENFAPASDEEKFEADLVRAEARYRSGYPQQALEEFKRLSDTAPQNSQAIVGVLKCLIDLGKPNDAIITANAWLVSQEKEANVLYWKGIAEYQINRLEAASATLTDATLYVPASDVFLPVRRNILTALSRVLTEQGKAVEAQVYHRILSENSNTAARDQMELAMTAIREGNVDEAKDLLNDVLKLAPGNQQTAMMLGALYANTGDLEAGVEILSENLDPETAPVQFIKAATMARLELGQRQEAFETLARSVAAKPEDPEILAMHGVLALSLPGHEQEGVESLNKTLSIDPEQVRPRLALSQYYLRNNDTDQALAQLRSAFATDPSQWAITGTYLSLLQQLGQDQEAERVRDALLSQLPGQTNAVIFASMIDLNLGNSQQAIDRLQELVRKDSKAQAPMLALAAFQYKSGRRDDAIDTLLNAARLDLNNLSPLQRATQIQAQARGLAGARVWLAELGSKSPELSNGAAALSALISISQGDLPQARAHLKPVLGSETAFVRQIEGRLLRAETVAAARSTNWNEARAKAAEAKALQPDNVHAALLPVIILQMEGKSDEATNALTEVERNFGSDPTVIRARATLISESQGAKASFDYLLPQWEATNNTDFLPILVRLAQTAAPDQVGRLAEHWMAANPQNPAAHLAKADWLLNREESAKAVTHYEFVVSRLPDHVPALNNLAWLLRDADRARALELASHAAELAPESAPVLDTYGWLLHLDGDNDRAAKVIEKALALAPGNEDIMQHLEAINAAR